MDVLAWASAIRSRTVVPGGPLILAVATLLDTPASDSPFTAITKSPFLIPAVLGGRVLEHVEHAQPALVLVHAHAHAVEAALHGVLELLALVRA